MGDDATESEKIEAFIARWQGQEGGQERANYALFLAELCDALGLPHPEPAGADHARNDYVFERAVNFWEGGDKIGHGRIDLYKRGCFVLEAKQSRQGGKPKAARGRSDTRRLRPFIFLPASYPRGPPLSVVFTD